MFQAQYSYLDMGSATAEMRSYKNPYVVQAQLVTQLRSLICEAALKLKLTLSVHCKQEDKTCTQKYVLLDEEGREKIRFEHKTRAQLTNFIDVVKQPRALGHINNVIGKLNHYTDKAEESETFQRLLHRLAHLNEDKFLLDAYEQDKEEFALLFQSKQGRETLEVYIEQ